MIQLLARFFVKLVQRYLPDAYLLAILLTFAALGLAWTLTDSSLPALVIMWGDGLMNILTFAMQMILILVTGHCLAVSDPVAAFLRRLARLPRDEKQAVALIALVSGLACYLNWGFGLIVAAFLARAVAEHLPAARYALLVAAGYSGYVCWHGGLSGSIPLALATPGHIVENLTGIVPVSQTIFSPANLILIWTIILTVPLILRRIASPIPQSSICNLKSEISYLQSPISHLQSSILPQPSTISHQPSTINHPPSPPPSPASRLENSRLVNFLFGLLGLAYLVTHFATAGLSLTLNIMILLFFTAGVILHDTPIRYARAMNEAIRGAGGIALQFPLYGGIQGILVSSGLAHVIANAFLAVSTTHTFPLFTFLAGGLINLFVPSGGGQWAVQGPISIPAGLALGVPPAKTALAIAYGDMWTNMIQPFWALPLLGIVGLAIRDIMGYCVITLLWTGLLISAALLLF